MQQDTMSQNVDQELAELELLEAQASAARTRLLRGSRCPASCLGGLPCLTMGAACLQVGMGDEAVAATQPVRAPLLPL